MQCIRREGNIAPEAETGDEAAPAEMVATDTENTTNDIRLRMKTPIPWWKLPVRKQQ